MVLPNLRELMIHITYDDKFKISKIKEDGEEMIQDRVKQWR